MKITALVENTSHCELRSAPGLALYIETPRHKLLFDLGPDDTLFQNCERRGIDLGAVDTVVISHGHGDHGGALRGRIPPVESHETAHSAGGGALRHCRRAGTV